MINEVSGLGAGQPILIELQCLQTGALRTARVGRDRWEDVDFRDGYEAMWMQDGFAITSVDTGPGTDRHLEHVWTNMQPNQLARSPSCDFVGVG